MTTSEKQAQCPELLALATPDLYRRNAFRVLTLQVGATAADARRTRQRLEMRRKLGAADPTLARGTLALQQDADEDAVRTALERINDPQARLLDELFWPWPLGSDDDRHEKGADAALDALARGAEDEALSLWRRAAAAGDAIALHNLAVFGHLRAIEGGGASGASAARRRQRRRQRQRRQTGPGDSALASRPAAPGANVHWVDTAAWASALRDWAALIAADGFWDALRRRVEAIDDRTLTRELVHRIRRVLPQALLQINARLAVARAQAGDADGARAHADILAGAPFAPAAAAAALRDSVEPLRRRLLAAIEHARRYWEQDPLHGDDHVMGLHAEALRHLGVVDLLLAGDDPGRQDLHDLVAEAMLEGQVAFVRKSEDWERSLTLLGHARALAAGASLRDRLDGQIEVLREAAASGNDWCAPGYWELPENVLARAEQIRASASAGAYEDAIQALLELGAYEDPIQASLERGARRPRSPLRRCLAYCLSLHGIRTANAAMAEFDGRTAAGEFLFTLRTALAYLELANEVDPGDAGVTRNLASLREIAGQLHVQAVSTSALRKRLGLDRKSWRTTVAGIAAASTLAAAADAEGTAAAPAAGSSGAAATSTGGERLGAALVAMAAMAFAAILALSGEVTLDTTTVQWTMTAAHGLLLAGCASLLRGVPRLVGIAGPGLAVALAWSESALPFDAWLRVLGLALPVVVLLLACLDRLRARRRHWVARAAGAALLAYLGLQGAWLGLPLAIDWGLMWSPDGADLAALYTRLAQAQALTWTAIGVVALAVALGVRGAPAQQGQAPGDATSAA